MLNFQLHFGLKLLLCFSGPLLFLLEQEAMAEVTIQTNDGREITGEVDEQTDDQLLWIRQQSDRIMLTTSIPWSKVHSAFRDDEILPKENLQEQLDNNATAEPFGFLVQQVVYEFPTDCGEGCYASPHISPPIRQPKPKVRSLSVSAHIANLDRDVEPDGIELTIAAIDEYGVAVPVKGNIYVKLWGERIQPHGSLVRVERLQQWSQTVKPIDFIDGVATYALRFRTVRPEFDFGLHSEAVVNVRLGVRGQGNFEASAPVALRPFQPFRDRLQLRHGSRFLPDELTDEVLHQYPHRTHTRHMKFN